MAWMIRHPRRSPTGSPRDCPGLGVIKFPILGGNIENKARARQSSGPGPYSAIGHRSTCSSVTDRTITVGCGLWISLVDHEILTSWRTIFHRFVGVCPPRSPKVFFIATSPISTLECLETASTCLTMALYSKSSKHPPLDGTITIAETIEFHWQHNADLPAYVFHEEGKDTNDITEITYLEFGRATHRVANVVNSKFPSVTGRPVVAFMALTDTLLYQAISLGLMKSGFIVRILPFGSNY